MKRKEKKKKIRRRRRWRRRRGRKKKRVEKYSLHWFYHSISRSLNRYTVATKSGLYQGVVGTRIRHTHYAFYICMYNIIMCVYIYVSTNKHTSNQVVNMTGPLSWYRKEKVERDNIPKMGAFKSRIQSCPYKFHLHFKHFYFSSFHQCHVGVKSNYW